MGFDGLRDYGPYLNTIARNVVADWWRRAGREVPTEGHLLQEAGDEAWVPSEEEAGPWADPGTIAVVQRYVAGLDAELRRIHQARFVSGLSQRDAARELGIGRQTLRTLEGRLRAGLARARPRVALSARRAQGPLPSGQRRRGLDELGLGARLVGDEHVHDVVTGTCSGPIRIAFAPTWVPATGARAGACPVTSRSTRCALLRSRAWPRPTR